MKKSVLLTALLGLLAIAGFSQTASYWSANNTSRSRIVADKATTRQSFPKQVKLFTLNAAPLRQALFAAVGTSPSAGRSAVISLPNAAGGVEEFTVFEASNFEPALQARFPEIRSFSGKGITDKAATLKLSISPQGVQTMVFRTGKANELIEPYSQDHTVYAVFASQREEGNLPLFCSTPDEQLATSLNQQVGGTGRSGGDLKTMRLAQSVTGEYSNYFGATSPSQVGVVLAAVNTTLTRANGVYEKDLALHLNLVAASTNVFYYNAATDPYTTSGNFNSQLQNTLTTNIGAAGYDIGHLFSPLPDGGNAGCIGCICVDGSKGSGWTSTLDGAPTGYTFDCIVMHEMGHQMGANHTFSHSNEGLGANKEVGSGITLMSYAGITAQDVASNFIDNYHEHSIAQIQANLAAKTCPVTTAIANATPVVAAVSNYTIPRSTPFALTGSATDANAGDVLTYSWEQNDAATSAQTGVNSVASPTKLTGPNWISFRPTTSPTRLFPQLATILAGGQVTGPLPGGDAGANSEALSSVARTLNFRLTVRDNAPYRTTAPVSVGQTAFTDMVVTVSAASGPFVVTAPNTAVTWAGGTSRTITWDVAATTAAPVSCANVKISLSTDGGQTFPTVLAASTPNDGTEALTIPNTPSNTARIKVEAVGNIFFDISNTNFTIIDGQKPLIEAGATTITAQGCMPGNGVIDPGETVTVNFCVQNNGGVATTNLVGTLQNTGGVNFPSGPQTFGAISPGGTPVCRPFTFTASGACGSTITASINFQDGATNLGTVTYTFTLGVVTSATAVATNNAAITISTAIGPATPYPSNIAVSGITGTVTKVTVQLNNLSHTWPDDLDILLVSPTGQKIMLMSDAGGSIDVVGANLVFDDAAATVVPDAGPIPTPNVTTAYKPTDFLATDVLPAPAPARPYTTTLSSLNNLNPNGTWSLYVADDETGDAGSITGGWTLNITTGSTTCCVTPPPVINAPTVTQPSCTTPTGTIVVNATGGTLEYSIDNGATYQLSNTFSNLTAGSYNIKVRQQGNPANSTTYFANPVVINAAPASPAAPTVTVAQPSCTAATGTITVTAPIGSGITYSIIGDAYQASPVFNNLSPSTYNVRARANSGCISAATPVTINAQPATPATPSVTVVQPSCSVATGTITVNTPTGPGITFSINGTNYQAGNVFTNVAPGNYSVTAKNSDGCVSAVTPVTINAAPATLAAPTVSVVQPSCTIATGSITVNSPTGSDITYSINGTTYQSGTTFSNIAPGNYNVTARSGSCTSAATPVTINAQPTDNQPPVITPRNITINLDATGNATIQPADVIVSATDNCTLDSSSFTVTPNRFSCSGSAGSTNHQAYIANTNTGNQAWTGELGMDFKVNRAGGILVKQLGAFDHQGNGITGTQSGGIRVAIFNKATQSIVAGLETVIVGNADQYAGNHRMKNIAPVTLLPGDYVIVSKGYNTTELNGNVSFGGITPTPGDEGNGAISFTGSSRFGTPNTATFSYPQNGDGGPTNRYLAGTFVYDVAATADTGSANHQAYVASTTTGNQSWEGELGMEFRVNQGSGIIVKQLGTFDHQGNGITGTQSGGIRVAIFNKATQSIVAGLETVITGNADSYTGNHRMKNVTPVTLMPGDYVIVSKGYNDNERNGNSGFAGVTPVPGDVSNGAISYTGTGLYGNPNSATFSYPQNGDGGPANRYLAGTFVYDVPGTTGGGVGNNSVVISVKDAAGNIGYATATVTVTDANGVCNQSQPMVSMTATTAVAPVLAGAATMRTEGIKVYPNPSTGQFTVQLSDVKVPKATLQIMDANGKIVEQRVINITGKMPSLTVPVDISRQAPGMYVIKVISADGVQTTKVVVSR